MRLGEMSVGGASVTAFLAPEAQARVGWAIVAIDGQDAFAAVQRFADDEVPVSNDAAARFSFALSSLAFVARDLTFYRAPQANSTNVTLQNPDTGAFETIDVPWMASAAAAFTSSQAVRARCVRAATPPPVPDCSQAPTSSSSLLSSSSPPPLSPAPRSAQHVSRPPPALATGSAAEAIQRWATSPVPAGGLARPRSATTPGRGELALLHASMAVAEPPLAASSRAHWAAALGHWAIGSSLRPEQHLRLLAGMPEPSASAATSSVSLLPGRDTPEAFPPYWVDSLVAAGAVSRAELQAAVTSRRGTGFRPSQLVRLTASKPLSASPLDASVSVSDSALSSITLLEDFSDIDGVQIFSAEQAGRGSVIVVTVPTFNPQSVASCFAELLASACPTREQLGRAQTCFLAGMDAFLAHAVTAPAAHATRLGASKLLVDLRGNRGGNVLLGQLFMATAFRGLKAMPSRVAGGVMRFRTSPVVTAMARFIEAKAAATIGGSLSSVFPAFKLLNMMVLQQQPGQAAEDVVALTSSSALPDFSWYTVGETAVAGSTKYTVSKPFKLLDVSAAIMTVPDLTPGVTWNSSNTAVVSDLLCGSMCGQVLKTLQELDQAKVVAVGGLPFVRGDTTAFVGGFIRSSVDDFAAELLALNRHGFTDYIAPSFLPTSANMGYNDGMLYSWRRTDVPMQFSPMAADAALYSWDEVGPTDALVSAVHSVLQPAAVGSLSALSAERDALLVAVIVLAVAASVLGLAVLLCFAHNRSRGGIWERLACCEPCSGGCTGGPTRRCNCPCGRPKGARPATDADPNGRHVPASAAVPVAAGDEPGTDPAPAPLISRMELAGDAASLREAMASRSAGLPAATGDNTPLVGAAATPST